MTFQLYVLISVGDELYNTRIVAGSKSFFSPSLQFPRVAPVDFEAIMDFRAAIYGLMTAAGLFVRRPISCSEVRELKCMWYNSQNTCNINQAQQDVGSCLRPQSQGVADLDVH